MIGSTLAFFSVVLGAFGAHALKAHLDEKSLAIYHTATEYQMYHALALIGLGLWSAQNPTFSTELTGWAFTGGCVIFSGSLYLLAITRISLLGAITPIGGVLFLVGWFSFGQLMWKS